MWNTVKRYILSTLCVLLSVYTIMVTIHYISLPKMIEHTNGIDLNSMTIPQEAYDVNGQIGDCITRPESAAKILDAIVKDKYTDAEDNLIGNILQEAVYVKSTGQWCVVYESIYNGSVDGYTKHIYVLDKKDGYVDSTSF